jgi:hypothetical protein
MGEERSITSTLALKKASSVTATLGIGHRLSRPMRFAS